MDKKLEYILSFILFNLNVVDKHIVLYENVKSDASWIFIYIIIYIYLDMLFILLFGWGFSSCAEKKFSTSASPWACRACSRGIFSPRTFFFWTSLLKQFFKFKKLSLERSSKNYFIIVV